MKNLTKYAALLIVAMLSMGTLAGCSMSDAQMTEAFENLVIENPNKNNGDDDIIIENPSPSPDDGGNPTKPSEEPTSPSPNPPSTNPDPDPNPDAPHVHSWRDITEEKWVVDVPAWSELVFDHTLCIACGQKFYDNESHDAHVLESIRTGGQCGAWSIEHIEVHHPEEGHYEYPVVGRECTGCNDKELY